MGARTRHVALVRLLGERLPDLVDAAAAVERGEILVDGRVMANPAARVARTARLQHRPSTPPRGAAKLAHALDAFAVDPAGRVAVDVGASTGGFTRTLLDRGAATVYAVDAGHGQLLGSLRADPRVVDLEGTNLSALGPELIPDEVGIVTVDVSYLALAAAAPQLGGLRLVTGADLVALVKPMFELALDRLPDRPDQHAQAVRRAAAGLTACGWGVVATTESALRGRRGAVEYFIHARRPA